MVGSVLSESLAKFDYLKSVKVLAIFSKQLFPVFEGPSSAAIALPVGYHSCHDMPRGKILLSLYKFFLFSGLSTR